MKKLLIKNNMELDNFKKNLVDKLSSLNIDIELDNSNPVLFTIVDTIFASKYFSLDGMIESLKLNVLLEKDAELLTSTHDYVKERYIQNMELVHEIRQIEPELAKKLKNMFRTQ